MKQHCNERLKGMVTWKLMDKQHSVILLGDLSWSINYIAEMSGQHCTLKQCVCDGTGSKEGV
jgi:hypothetical protein